MALTEIEYGALASSEVMNNNFQYLDNRISTLSDIITSNQASINSNIASISSTLSSVSGSLNSEIEGLNNSLENVELNLSESGVYITTYINGNSWYREYFSDSEKTSRVWLEQGGLVSNNAPSTQTLLKNFSNTDYMILATGYKQSLAAIILPDEKSVSSFIWRAIFYNGSAATVQSCSWFACGV